MTLRTEYPRPQFRRDEWTCLNGEWEFAFDDDNRGLDEHWQERTDFDRRIQVPFAYQSKLSGIHDVSRHDVVWYRRYFVQSRPDDGNRVLLHFGAVDYEATVFVNGRQVVHHIGGNTPFSADITPYLNEDGEQSIAVRVWDPQDDERIPRGKQYWNGPSAGIWYTNTTGIWQTVWCETVSAKRLDDVRITTDIDRGLIRFDATGAGMRSGDKLRYRISYHDVPVADGELTWRSDELVWEVDYVQNHIFRTGFHNEDEPLWSPEHPNLVDVAFDVIDGGDGRTTDHVDSYFGMRKIHIQNGMTYLNNRPYYQKLVLDQGYWPDGLLTAPDDDAYRKDIELSKSMGFNGCRKHQKMEDPRFLYWADKLGYIVWGECAAAPAYTKSAVDRLMREWQEIVDRDYNHPSIVTWVPFNESWGVPFIRSNREQQHCTQAFYHYLHSIDPTRLVESNDGWEQTETDICAIHNYSHGQSADGGEYAEYRAMLADRDGLLRHPSTCRDIYASGFSYQGEPILLTEFGGIGFDVSGEPGWGYTSAANEEQFLKDYARIMDAVYSSKALWGYCYTQLTDVEQEINGLLTYDRQPKCDPKAIKAINDRYHTNRIVQ
ncbi:glycoside hydrolase family 2 protein [Bifidobacterium biavatii]|uniref:Glycoside hydrolase family 2 n=1 Tax=Bifidobacterium biavatii DSM 23969 TaxID=1437608 RepID=A0A086ZLU3_9BIFI|nr:glycoside hydrolase family 2 [Bifidobacterium biavatii]KFI47493.1 glycoside hydrolase family 2 [Bifidobacterium biavatii DSM 23969]